MSDKIIGHREDISLPDDFRLVGDDTTVFVHCVTRVDKCANESGNITDCEPDFVWLSIDDVYDEIEDFEYKHFFSPVECEYSHYGEYSRY